MALGWQKLHNWGSSFNKRKDWEFDIRKYKQPFTFFRCK